MSYRFYIDNKYIENNILQAYLFSSGAYINMLRTQKNIAK